MRRSGRDLGPDKKKEEEEENLEDLQQLGRNIKIHHSKETESKRGGALEKFKFLAF